MTVGLAQFLTIEDSSGKVLRKHQNYWIEQTVDGFTFEPFNVAAMISMVSSGAESLNIELLPNVVNFGLVETGLQQYYVATVEQYQFMPPASGVPSTKILNAAFTGEFQSATLSESTVTLTVGSNLDSVESQVPPRSYTTTLTGTPPKL